MTKLARSAARAALALGMALWGPTVLAQAGGADNYPTKPLRLVVPFPAGASSDVVGRILAQKLSEYVGQQVIADNRAGAGGNLGIAHCAKSPPDGYTMVIATANLIGAFVTP